MKLRIALVGAGGHAKVVADIVSCLGHDLVAFADAGQSDQPRHFMGRPLIAGSEGLAAIPHDAVVVAVGVNANRRREFEALIVAGERVVSVIHPSAIVATSSTVGDGTVICAGAIVNPEAHIGSNVILNTRSSIDHDCVVEDHVHLAPGVVLGGNVHIESGAFVGIGAVVKPGVRVGACAVVGAGSVVLKDVPAGVTVVGVPAKPLSLKPK